MNVTIIEDEIPAAGYLKNILLEQHSINVENITIIETVQDSIIHFQKSMPDLVFMDVHLADGNSMEILEAIEITCPIIFTTAYDEYAIEAFKLFTIDYLLKPFEEAAVIDALEKLKTITSQISQEKVSSFAGHLKKGEGRLYQEHFLINYGNELRTINASEIAYFYGSGKHLFIYTVNRESFLYDSTIRGIIKEVDPQFFFKINRNYVVNIHSIKRVIKQGSSKLQVELVPPPPDEDKVTISKSALKAFKNWMNH